MARRGFFAEIQHLNRVAARERDRAERAAVREHNAAVRRTEQARRAAARAKAQRDRAAEAERRLLEKEEREAHIAVMEAEAEERNLELAETYSEIDSLLAATLGVDDYVDLETLRIAPAHPPFDRSELELPIPAPASIPDPPEPIFTPPDSPKGLAKLFGRKKHAEAVAKATAAHERAVAEWQSKLNQLPARRQAAAEAHALAETERVVELTAERRRYSDECAAREAEVIERNRPLDELISNLAYGGAEAIQEYVAIVLSNSVYPDQFPVDHEFSFEPQMAELKLRVVVPGPDKVPAIKAYKYAKATDEITSTMLPQKVVRERYASAIHQVALRSIHEVFEADRRGIIRTISLEVGTDTVDPATGRQTYVPFVLAGAERAAFLELNLSAVVPTLTLEHIGASISKNPFGLVAAQTTGVRRQ